ncbi:hypothetical protein DFP72DRAFT_1172562 [Ephemerocybe angulata]|uniref:Zn(2)-C6 fungal-type domain-containing protein n=1 Tax=Ephemerocybe angulata TaxID=980116 RepID=A0A8H6HR54_9AGAR|nr:hypothetical protein DFP72DRAFT_1172562 [Tulosesus angulatus]
MSYTLDSILPPMSLDDVKRVEQQQDDAVALVRRNIAKRAQTSCHTCRIIGLPCDEKRPSCHWCKKYSFESCVYDARPSMPTPSEPSMDLNDPYTPTDHHGTPYDAWNSPTPGTYATQPLTGFYGLVREASDVASDDRSTWLPEGNDPGHFFYYTGVATTDPVADLGYMEYNEGIGVPFHFISTFSAPSTPSATPPTTASWPISGNDSAYNPLSNLQAVEAANEAIAETCALFYPVPIYGINTPSTPFFF